MASKRQPKTVLILVGTRDEAGWALSIEDDYARRFLPVLGKPKSRRKTVPIEIQLHMPDKMCRVSAKCATVVWTDK